MTNLARRVSELEGRQSLADPFGALVDGELAELVAVCRAACGDADARASADVRWLAFDEAKRARFLRAINASAGEAARA